MVVAGALALSVTVSVAVSLTFSPEARTSTVRNAVVEAVGAKAVKSVKPPHAKV